MVIVATRRRGNKNGFGAVAEPFLQGEGLPFSDVLSAEWIQRVFCEENALFGQDDIFSTEIVLWAFLAQTLRDGKGAACSAAVSEIATYMLQTGQRPPSGDTGDYCRARAKLSLPALQRLVGESARQLERDADESWLWKGLHAKLVDGFTFTMPDTPENQGAWVTLTCSKCKNTKYTIALIAVARHLHSTAAKRAWGDSEAPFRHFGQESLVRARFLL